MCVLPRALVISILLCIPQKSLTALRICDCKYLIEGNESFVSSTLSLTQSLTLKFCMCNLLTLYTVLLGNVILNYSSRLNINIPYVANRKPRASQWRKNSLLPSSPYVFLHFHGHLQSFSFKTFYGFAVDQFINIILRYIL